KALGGFRDAWRFVPQRFHEAQHTVRTRRATEQHGANEAFAQLFGEVVKDLVARRLDVLEQLLHELVVVIRERLEHGKARGLLPVERVALERHDFGTRILLVDIGAFEGEVDEAADEIAGKGRDLPQQKLAARRRLQQRQRVVNGGIGLVDLVEEQKTRDILLFEL